MSNLGSKENFILYNTPSGDVTLNVLLQNETIWLTQEQMSQLFDRERSVITKHIGNVFSEGELEEKSNVQNLHISGSDKPVKFYNLDVIISVGYRVKSQRGTQFRIWATKTLKEYIIKGFVLDDIRLKQGEAVFGKDYFKELLERVRSIRASEAESEPNERQTFKPMGIWACRIMRVPVMELTSVGSIKIPTDAMSWSAFFFIIYWYERNHQKVRNRGINDSLETSSLHPFRYLLERHQWLAGSV